MTANVPGQAQSVAVSVLPANTSVRRLGGGSRLRFPLAPRPVASALWHVLLPRLTPLAHHEEAPVEP